MRTLSIDIETYSSVDIKTSGAYAYVDSPDFEILLFAYAFDDEPVQLIDLLDYEDVPDDVLSALTNLEIIKTAFNANFERTCLAKHFSLPMPPEQWRCTAVHALTLGLPGYLDGVASSLKLEQQKDAGGKALIKYFSVPCKPTKVNGGRTRNMPWHAPEKWDQYKAYCIQDVVTEREVRYKLEKHPVPEFEQRLWELDQRINDRGVQVDTQLVDHAIACDEQYKNRLTIEASELTGLDNPNSLPQLKGWLMDRGLEVDGLTKDTIPILLNQADSDEVTRALELRQELSKTSVRKYEAMRRGRCNDSRVRGILQFYGANRTGRWAGRLVQVHNLPKNTMSDLKMARDLLRSGDYEMLEMLFDRVPNVLSQLIRTAFIPSEGRRFIVSDFSAIEARVIAWLAGEQWRMDVFNSHGKIYEASASTMFKVPLERIVKGNPEYDELRPKGKVAELACIAVGQLVLTDKGLVRIENVTTDHLLWDGLQWVNHGGVIDKGIKGVITYEGLTATEDHIVWIEGESEPVRFGYAASRGAHLLRSGNGGRPIRLGKDYQPRKKMEKRLERSTSINRMRKLRCKSVDALLQFKARIVKGLPSLLTTQADSEMARQKINIRKTEVCKSEGWKLRKLRSTWDSIQFYFYIGGRALDYRKSRIAITLNGDGSDQQRWALRAEEYSICTKDCQSGESSFDGAFKLESRRMALRPLSGNSETFTRNDAGKNYRGGTASGKGQAQELAGDRRKVRVYDILSAGPRNRFTVSGRLVHNCGYQGGPNALKQMGALEMGLKEEDLKGIIDAWRLANPAIKQFWYDVGNAAIDAVGDKRVVKLQHGLTFIPDRDFLFIQLPSGRKLAYYKPILKPDPKYGRLQMSYEGVDQDTKKWGRLRTYGGKLVENIVQAVARDCLANALMRLDDCGYEIAMHVHDEAVLDVPNNFSYSNTLDLDKVSEIMSQPIDWAPGLPLRADGFETEFYMKD